jgi:hypothetical protein
MEEWLISVWDQRSDALTKPRSLLTTDAFCDHPSHRIRNRLRNKNTQLVIIPSGMTSQLQPLDVSINKPFNILSVNTMILDGIKTIRILAPNGKTKRPSVSIKVEVKRMKLSLG